MKRQDYVRIVNLLATTYNNVPSINADILLSILYNNIIYYTNNFLNKKYSKLSLLLEALSPENRSDLKLLKTINSQKILLEFSYKNFLFIIDADLEKRIVFANVY